MSKKICCKNCDENFTGNYCYNCGQKANTNYIDLKYFIHEISNGIFSIDKGILFTIRALTYHPIQVAVGYIKGKRVKLFSPYSYLIVMATAIVLLKKVGLQINYDKALISEDLNRINSETPFWLLFVFSTPFFSFFAKLYYRKRTPYNIWEYIIILTYFTGHALFYLLIYKILFLLFPNIQEQVTVFVVLLIFAYLIGLIYSLHSKNYSQKLLLLIRTIAWFITSLVFSVLSIVLLRELYNLI
ncbi:DUF3667 domain-containing protein [Psychroserpens damuponensis]|uniref:DUF3667 domain-containing protein n=1 Tax=Psychroserpens damuponensis TaxID=943936 RepID=UPI00058C5C15|nr:DUF3667 domain-containing protein [Psychroserpens damuponensis]